MEIEAKFAIANRQEYRDLLRVPGVGPVTLEAIQPYLLPLPNADDVAAR